MRIYTILGQNNIHYNPEQVKSFRERWYLQESPIRSTPQPPLLPERESLAVHTLLLSLPHPEKGRRPETCCFRPAFHPLCAHSEWKSGHFQPKCPYDERVSPVCFQTQPPGAPVSGWRGFDSLVLWFCQVLWYLTDSLLSVPGQEPRQPWAAATGPGPP